MIYVIGIFSQSFSLEKRNKEQEKEIAKLKLENQQLKKRIKKAEDENKHLIENKHGLLQQLDIYKNKISSLHRAIQDKENISMLIISYLPDELTPVVNQKIKLYNAGKIKEGKSDNENS